MYATKQRRQQLHKLNSSIIFSTQNITIACNKVSHIENNNKDKYYSSIVLSCDVQEQIAKINYRNIQLFSAGNGNRVKQTFNTTD